MTEILTILKTIRFQLIILAALLILFLLSAYGLIMDPESLTVSLRSYFVKYGIPIVIVVSFIENIIGVNIYFPGSITILTAMSLTAGNPSKAIQTWLAIVIPSTFSQIVDYSIGRQIAIKLPIRNKSETIKAKKRSNLSKGLLFLGYWHPHFAALTSAACGKSQMPFARFLGILIVSSLFWNIFWGITMYYYGAFTTESSTLFILFFLYILCWMGWDVFIYLKTKRSK